MLEKFVENEYMAMHYMDNILFGTCKVKKIDLQIASDIVSLRLANFGDVDYPTMWDFCAVTELTKDARDFFAVQESSRRFRAVAVLTDSQVGNIIFNFYMHFSAPKVPTRLFKNKNEALNWLQGFL